MKVIVKIYLTGDDENRILNSFETFIEIGELPTDDLCERSFCNVVTKVIDILRREKD